MTKYREVNNILLQRDQLTPTTVCRAKEGACYRGPVGCSHLPPKSGTASPPCYRWELRPREVELEDPTPGSGPGGFDR